jgi:hypothetical protein
MGNQLIQERITKIDLELTSIRLKSSAIGMAGGVASAFLLAKDKKILGKIGCFLLGSLVAGIPTTLIFSSKVTELLAERENLTRQLNLIQ